MKCQPMKSCLPVKIESHRFVPRDFIGGDAALDFINTVTGRDRTSADGGLFRLGLGLAEGGGAALALPDSVPTHGPASGLIPLQQPHHE